MENFCQLIAYCIKLELQLSILKMYSFTISLLSAFAGLMTMWWPWKRNLVCCTGALLPASDWRGQCLNGSLCHKNCTCGSSLLEMLLEMQHSFLWVLFSSPALISLTSIEFSCYVCMYVCMYVCIYTINCRNVILQMVSIHSLHATLFRCGF